MQNYLHIVIARRQRNASTVVQIPVIPAPLSEEDHSVRVTPLWTVSNVSELSHRINSRGRVRAQVTWRVTFKDHPLSSSTTF